MASSTSPITPLLLMHGQIATTAAAITVADAAFSADRVPYKSASGK
jgi:hypothetical protein